MNRPTRSVVARRAGDECEYCGFAQSDLPTTLFQIDHVVSRQHGGTDDLSNLALACPLCNTRKGTNLSAIDPESGRIVALFNPRQDRWYDHSSRVGPVIVGLTPEGRAIARLLGMNSEDRIGLREDLE